jgi:hypothetical protein
MKMIIKFDKFKINEDGGAVATSPSSTASSGTANSNLGNTNGMGEITPPIPGDGNNGAVSTSLKDSTSGSGDLPAYGKKTPFKKEKKKKSDRDLITKATTDEKSTMYVKKWSDFNK